MTNDSYYQRKARPVPARPPLAGALEAEIGVIGGGLAGLGTVLSLAERGSTAVLLEGQTIGAGASGRNGGMVSAGFAPPPPPFPPAARPGGPRPPVGPGPGGPGPVAAPGGRPAPPPGARGGRAVPPPFGG